MDQERSDVVDETPGDSPETALIAVDTDDRPEQADQIKGEIEETRSQMGDTIDAIQEKLSFSNLSEQVSEHVTNAVETAKDAVYDATVGKAANFMKDLSSDISKSSIVKTAQNNPFPFILIGLGAGLLAYQSFTDKRAGSRTYRGQSRGREFDELRRDGAVGGNRSSSLVGDARTKLSDVSDSVSSAAGTVYEKVTGAVDTAYSGTGEAVSQAYGKVGDAGQAVREQYDHYIEENPLAVGAVALALGAAVGFAIPATQYEGELMGKSRQDLMGKVQDTASGFLDKTTQAVTDAGRDISQKAMAAVRDK
jgi:ElaB/YqjD/DUF883 family membrane-anchored ribosome-binding protein